MFQPAINIYRRRTACKLQYVFLTSYSRVHAGSKTVESRCDI